MTFELILDRLYKQRNKIDDWFEHSMADKQKPIYHSVDVRFSGFKISPVDINCFPSGFNNISVNCIDHTVSICRKLFYKKNIVLIIEDFNRNVAYLENVKILQNILSRAGNVCNLAFFHSERYVNMNEENFYVPKLVYKNGSVQTSDGFKPDCIIINDDMSNGYPEFLNYYTKTIYPMMYMGWFLRRKNFVFDTYNTVVNKFANKFKFDSWFFSPFSYPVSVKGLVRTEDLEKLAYSTHAVLQKIKAKYLQYDIKSNPYVVIKSDHGTYGMSIMIINDAEQLYTLNKKVRKTMKYDRVKNDLGTKEYIIQEGVSTAQQYKEYSAETLLYHFNGTKISQLYRFHKNKSFKDNLNSRGAEFVSCSIDNNYTQYAMDMVSNLTTLSLIEENEANILKDSLHMKKLLY